MSNKICPVCGKSIMHSASNRQEYCSEECRRKAYAHRNIEKIARRTNTMNGIRAQVVSHYNSKCAICGWHLPSCISKDGKKQYTMGCEIHHIIPVCEGGENTAKNLILLCPNCHKLANLGFISREELYEYVKATLQPDEINLWFGKGKEDDNDSL